MISCNACAYAIQYCDTSHISEDNVNTVLDTIESLGMVTVTDTGDAGYFHCDVCKNDTIGSEYLLEQV